MDNVIQFADVAFRAKGKRYDWDKDRCPHKNLTLDDNGEIVTCDDCNRQIGAYWAVRHITELWSQHSRTMERRAAEINKQITENVSLLAARRVERAWRSRKMVPVCPHCHEPIFAEDGFGGSSIDKQIAKRRRDAQRPEKT